MATLALGAVLAGGAALIFTLVALLTLFRYNLGQIDGEQLRTGETLAISVIVSGILALVYLVPAIQRGVARVIPLRPGSPVDYIAVVFALLFLGFQVGSQLAFDVLAQVTKGPPLTLSSILAQDLPLIVIAFLGVGIFIRRSPGQAADRLGLRPPRNGWWWAVALVMILAFLLVGYVIEPLARAVTPDQMKRVTEANNAVFGQFNNPLAVVVLAAVAGVAEELLFRGAMQPRFGLIATAILFATAHTQDGITFASLEIFILGLGLGILRVRSGLLTCMVTHVGYDVAVGVIGLMTK